MFIGEPFGSKIYLLVMGCDFPRTRMVQFPHIRVLSTVHSVQCNLAFGSAFLSVVAAVGKAIVLEVYRCLRRRRGWPV